jgi:hypothetical protein
MGQKMTTWQFAPRDMGQVRLCLEGQPDDQMVKADQETGVAEKTVRELRERTTWPPGLVLAVPSGDWLGLIIEVVKSELRATGRRESQAD